MQEAQIAHPGDATPPSPAPGDSIQEPLTRQLLAHPVYRAVDSMPALRVFMAHHVFAVWDFMSLVKRLQRELTCVELPWREPDDVTMARFINDIVLAEESDVSPDGGAASHLALYLDAMREVGADAEPFVRFQERLQCGVAPIDALQRAGAPPAAARFVTTTLDCALHASTVEVMAFFLYGREDVIPAMFERVLTASPCAAGRAPGFRYYLERHIELDGDEHGPAAHAMLERFCGSNEQRVNAACAAAARAVQARLELWDGVLNALPSRAPSTPTYPVTDVARWQLGRSRLTRYPSNNPPEE